MLRRWPISHWIALACLLLAPALAGALDFPALTGRVVDEAQVLDESTKAELEQALAKHEAQSTEQIVVVTLASLRDQSIEEYGVALGRHWGIGQKDKNNGALLIIAPKERKLRIEVGYGLEDRLTDAASALIIQRVIVPYMKQGDYPGGIRAGTMAILSLLDGNALEISSVPEHKKPGASVWFGAIGFPLLFLFIFMVHLFALATGRGRFSSGITIGGGGFSSGGSGGGFSGGGGSFGGGGSSGSW